MGNLTEKKKIIGNFAIDFMRSGFFSTPILPESVDFMHLVEIHVSIVHGYYSMRHRIC